MHELEACALSLLENGQLAQLADRLADKVAMLDDEVCFDALTAVARIALFLDHQGTHEVAAELRRLIRRHRSRAPEVREKQAALSSRTVEAWSSFVGNGAARFAGLQVKRTPHPSQKRAWSHATTNDSIVVPHRSKMRRTQ